MPAESPAAGACPGVIWQAAGDYQWDYKMGGEEITQSGGSVFISNGGGYSRETCIYTQNGY